MIAGPALEKFYAARTGQNRRMKEIVQRANEAIDLRRAGDNRAADEYVCEGCLDHH